MPYERELSAALQWVQRTDAISIEHFRIGVPFESKPDGTPVTEADRAVEQMLRKAVEDEFPGDGIIGEEFGDSDGGSRRWIIDPIDGTKNYQRGIPVFATLIALEENGVPVLGVVSAPGLRARWWATAGGGAFHDGEPIHVSEVARVEDADVITGGWDWVEEAGRVEGLTALSRAAKRQRGFGDFWGHLLVAQGSAEIMVEFAPLAAWDLAAVRAIVLEAGGRVTDLEGSDAREGACVTSNGLVHDEALALLRG
jgi:histidinol-phosphatase